MFKKLLRGILTLVGLSLGYVIGESILKIESFKNIKYLSSSVGSVLFFIFIALLVGVIFYLVSPRIYRSIMELIDYIEKNMKRFTLIEIIYGAIGAVIALIIMFFLARPLNGVAGALGPILYVLVNLLSAIIGMRIMVGKKDDMNNIILSMKKVSLTKDKTNKDKKSKATAKEVKAIPKVLDTSVIIDGRIFDICKTGFIEGPLVIPNFVLDELRHISDSSDSLKRIRGRRGLDILNKIQKELDIETQIWEGDFPNIAEVDAKLLKLTQTLDGKVITNDYNLNKVAEVQGVPVLNINELSNAIKPVVIPGEEMTVEVVKDGKESSQGVAYLDDGTMIVVEGGRKYMAKTIDVLVTSVLQTAAGRMIFAKPKDN